MAEDEVELARWTRAFINSLPNSAFAVIEPDFLSGKTEDKNARHLPYKDKSGKVDLPHLRNALARMDQIKPVTKSISADELRARARKKLIPLAKKHLPGSKFAKDKKVEKSEDMEMVTLSTDRPIKMEHIENESTEEFDVYQFELIDNDTYNGVYFSKEAIEHQYKAFKESDFLVSHGMDHSRKMLDQLGHVFDMTLKEEGEKVRAFVKSKVFKKTTAQQQAKILFDQGQANYISGGWKARISFNDDKGRFEVITPELREVSSTPTPAKKDAKLQNVLNSLNPEFTDDAPILEELEMTDDQETPPEPGDGELKEELPPKPTEQSDPDPGLALAQENAAKLEAFEKAQKEQARNLAIEKGVELGLDPTKFEGMEAPEIDRAIRLVNEAVTTALGNVKPDVALGGVPGPTTPEGLEEGSPEMGEHLLKEYFPYYLEG